VPFRVKGEWQTSSGILKDGPGVPLVLGPQYGVSPFATLGTTGSPINHYWDTTEIPLEISICFLSLSRTGKHVVTSTTELCYVSIINNTSIGICTAEKKVAGENNEG
jgi:hypothetical protein